MMFLFAFVFIGLLSIQAQTKGVRVPTKETKVVFVVNEKSDVVSLEMFDQKKSKYLLKKYPTASFYLGLLKGSYKLADNVVIPDEKAVITMFTNKKDLPGDMFLPGDMYLPGDMFLPGDMYAPGSTYSVNKTKLEVVKKTKSTMVFKRSK